MMKRLFILMALMLLISSSGCIDVTKFLKKDPEALEISGFTKGEVKETDDPFPGTQVEYTKDGKEYIVHFGLISKEELREKVEEESIAFVINSVFVDGKSYDIYRSPDGYMCVVLQRVDYYSWRGGSRRGKGSSNGAGKGICCRISSHRKSGLPGGPTLCPGRRSKRIESRTACT